MKNLTLIALILLFVTLLSKKKQKKYPDGVYFGKSKAIYNEENFWGQVSISIENGKIVTVDFKIIDSTSHEIFDNNYEKHYAGNQLYIEQCRNDWQGVIKYPESLIKSQDIDGVDVITGATWSYNMLKYATEDALKKNKAQ